MYPRSIVIAEVQLYNEINVNLRHVLLGHGSAHLASSCYRITERPQLRRMLVITVEKIPFSRSHNVFRKRLLSLGRWQTVPQTTVYAILAVAALRCTHRHSQDFHWGVHFLYQKSDDLFLVIALCYMVVCIHIYCYQPTNYLFISSAGVHLTKLSPIFASLPQKNLEKNFRRPGGAPPGYAYSCTGNYCICQSATVSKYNRSMYVTA